MNVKILRYCGTGSISLPPFWLLIPAAIDHE